MAIQILDTRKPLSAGQQITKGLASGLGQYLDRAAQSKLREIEQQRIAQGLEGLGFEQPEAQGLSQLPEQLQREVVKDIYTSQRAATKGSEKLRHEITLGERGALEQERELKELERLQKTGKIDSPLKVRSYRALGLEHKLSPETQAFQKVAQGFLRNAKNVFGSRITNFELGQYQQLFPSLIQSEQGRRLIIDNIRRTNEAAKVRAKAAREIMKENKNRIPLDFEDQIEQRVGTELDRLSPSSTFSSLGISTQGSTFPELPDPAQYNGKKFRNPQTGQIVQSNGSQWISIGG